MQTSADDDYYSDADDEDGNDHYDYQRFICTQQKLFYISIRYNRQYR